MADSTSHPPIGANSTINERERTRSSEERSSSPKAIPTSSTRKRSSSPLSAGSSACSSLSSSTISASQGSSAQNHHPQYLRSKDSSPSTPNASINNNNNNPFNTTTDDSVINGQSRNSSMSKSAGATQSIRVRLNFIDDGLWKKFSARRLEMIDSRSLSSKKASEQDAEISSVADALREEFGFEPSTLPEFDKLVRAAVQSVRRNRKRLPKALSRNGSQVTLGGKRQENSWRLTEFKGVNGESTASMKPMDLSSPGTSMSLPAVASYSIANMRTASYYNGSSNSNTPDPSSHPIIKRRRSLIPKDEPDALQFGARMAASPSSSELSRSAPPSLLARHASLGPLPPLVPLLSSGSTMGSSPSTPSDSVTSSNSPKEEYPGFKSYESSSSYSNGTSPASRPFRFATSPNLGTGGGVVPLTSIPTSNQGGISRSLRSVPDCVELYHGNTFLCSVRKEDVSTIASLTDKTKRNMPVSGDKGLFLYFLAHDGQRYALSTDDQLGFALNCSSLVRIEASFIPLPFRAYCQSRSSFAPHVESRRDMSDSRYGSPHEYGLPIRQTSSNNNGVKVGRIAINSLVSPSNGHMRDSDEGILPSIANLSMSTNSNESMSSSPRSLGSINTHISRRTSLSTSHHYSQPPPSSTPTGEIGGGNPYSQFIILVRSTNTSNTSRADSFDRNTVMALGQSVLISSLAYSLDKNFHGLADHMVSDIQKRLTSDKVLYHIAIECISQLGIKTDRENPESRLFRGVSGIVDDFKTMVGACVKEFGFDTIVTCLSLIFDHLIIQDISGHGPGWNVTSAEWQISPNRSGQKGDDGSQSFDYAGRVGFLIRYLDITCERRPSDNKSKTDTPLSQVSLEEFLFEIRRLFSLASSKNIKMRIPQGQVISSSLEFQSLLSHHAAAGDYVKIDIFESTGSGVNMDARVSSGDEQRQLPSLIQSSSVSSPTTPAVNLGSSRKLPIPNRYSFGE